MSDTHPAVPSEPAASVPAPGAPALSVIVPVCDEAGAIAALLQEILDKVGAAYRVEVIVVDDGSRDGTDGIVEGLAGTDGRITLIRHDGENDPADVVAMASRIDATRVGEVGLVAGIRRRRTAGVRRLIASRIGNGVRRLLLRDDCPDTACGLKVVPRPLFLAFPYFDSLHRYMPALTKRYGYGTLHVSVDDRPRMAGRSKYTNIGRALVGIVDLLGVVWLLRRTTVGANPVAEADRAP